MSYKTLAPHRTANCLIFQLKKYIAKVSVRDSVGMFVINSLLNSVGIWSGRNE